MSHEVSVDEYEKTLCSKNFEGTFLTPSEFTQKIIFIKYA